MPAGIPDLVERLIRQHIDSVEQLEVLLLLQRTGREWEATEVAADLRIDGESAARRLDDLAWRGFLHQEQQRYRYERHNGFDAAVRLLAETYRERRVAVITLIFSTPRRDDSARALADAFRLRRGPG